MFTKISRYYKQPDEVTTDARGRRTASKALRLLPAREGAFSHTLEDVDRLDHLAHKYYKQPRDWWHIVDANPSFESPHELMGQESCFTNTVAIEWDTGFAGGDPNWGLLLDTLHNEPGIVEAQLGQASAPYAVKSVRQGAQAAILPGIAATQLDATVQLQQIDPALVGPLGAAGFTFAGDIRADKPDAVTWRIQSLEDDLLLTFQFFVDEDEVRVFESAYIYSWVVTVVRNQALLTGPALQDVIVATGFNADMPERIGRIGKPVIIPPRKI